MSTVCRSCLGLLPAALLILALNPKAVGLDPGPDPHLGSGPADVEPRAAVVFETGHARLTLGPDGRVADLIDRATGKDRSAGGPRQPFALLRRGGMTFEPTACAASGDLITITFAEGGGTAVIRATPKKGYLVFEVVSLNGGKADELVFAALKVQLAKHQSWISGVAADDEFAVCVRALNLQTNLYMQGGPTPAFLPHAVSKYGFAGAKVAVAACSYRDLWTVLKTLVRDEGLPCSPLGGPFALDAEETRGSYVFATVSEKNADDWIAVARKAGLAQIHLIGWEQSLGHYEPQRELFPGGLEGLKAVVARIHSAGLRAGMHTLSGGIAPHDPFVTPVPDRRLAGDASFTLTAAVSGTDAMIATAEAPGDLDTMWAYMGRGNVLRIDDELVMYSGLSRAAPDGLTGFTGCTRGAFGTKAAAHSKGAKADHLFVRYGLFQPDEGSTLVDEVAECIAKAFNACGFDMIYMDGAEGMEGGWHGVARLREAIFRRLRGRVLVEASEWGYHSWPFHSRIGAYDHPNWGLKRFTDVHCRDAEAYRAGSLLPAQLGWWAILGPDSDHPSELPDEVEYLCAKALGTDAPMSFQGIEAGGRPWCARQDEYLETIGRYERLRLARRVSEEVLAMLRRPRDEFRLVPAADGAFQFVPAEYASHVVRGLDDSSAAWVVKSRFGDQPLRLRIEALYSPAPYGSPEGVVMTRFDRPEELVVAGPGEGGGTAPGVSASWAPAQEPLPPADTASATAPGSPKTVARYTAESKTATRTGAWAAIRRDFQPPLDLSKRGAMGVWVHGDSKGELLNFQLTNPPQFWGTWDEHYVRVDFQGWRYFELLFRERDAESFGDHVWPYGGTSDVYRSPLIRTHVSRLSIYYNDLPPGETATCFLSPVVALPVTKVQLRNPMLGVRGRLVVFPVTLESGQYIEMESAEDCRHFDERGALTGKIAPQGDLPRLDPGENPLTFTCEGPPGLRARVKVTVITLGEPIGPPVRP